MSYEIGVLDVGYEAAEDLSADKYKFVVLDPTTKKVRRPDSADEIAEGILQNAPVAGEAANVRVIGQSKLVGNAALGVNVFVSPEYVSASDAGKGQSAGTNWKATRAKVIEPSGAEDDLCTVQLVGPSPQGAGTLIGQTTASTISTAGDVTFTAAQVLGGLILRDPAGAGRADLVPTAANIIAALSQAGVGNSFEFTIRNTADGAETITVTTNTGITLSGTMTIAQNNSKRFLAVVTGSTTVTIYSLGTVVH